MSDKRYRLEFESHPEHLFVECSGILNAETDRLIDEDIRQKCSALDARRVLIDIRKMQGRLTILENFQAGASFGQRLGRFIRRIAIVDRSEYDYVKRNRFFEIVAVNRNVYLKFFGSIEGAEEWLLSANWVVSKEKPDPC